MKIDISEVLLDELSTLKRDIVSRQKAAGQVATGKTIRMYDYKVLSSNHAIFEGASWVSTLEHGRGRASKGNQETKKRFIENLKLWIKAKGIDYGNDPVKLERLANFFRWYMNKFGNKIFRNGTHKDVFTTPIKDFEERLINRVAALWQIEITNNI